jgi:eukaryotic translation initiation factor 2C
MLQIPATVLNTPRPKYANGVVDMKVPSWNLNNRKLLETNSKVLFKSYIIVVPNGDEEMSTFREPDTMIKTWKAFETTMHSTYAIGTFKLMGSVVSPHFGTDQGATRKSMEQAITEGSDFIILLLEKESKSAFFMFKDLADRQYGIQSLCIVWNAKRGFTSQYWGNIALKMNLKTGGINHTVAGLEKVMKETLVLGA